MDLVRIGATWYAVLAPKQEDVFYAISGDRAWYDDGKHPVLLSWYLLMTTISKDSKEDSCL